MLILNVGYLKTPWYKNNVDTPFDYGGDQIFDINCKLGFIHKGHIRGNKEKSGLVCKKKTTTTHICSNSTK